MSSPSDDIDLTPIVDAAALAAWTAETGVDWDDATGIQKHVMRERSLAYVTAAAPLIERAVREQVAREIEAGRVDLPRVASLPYEDGQRDGMTHAARIARGVQP